MISVVISNYNGRKILEKTLQKNCELFESIGIRDIIVVDDCSTDDSLDYLKEFKQVQAIKNPENQGLCKTCNNGVAAAKESIVLILNNDMIVQRCDLGAIQRLLAEKDVFSCSPFIQRYNQEGELFNEAPSYGFFKGGWFSSVNAEASLLPKEGEGAVPILWACGGAFFVSKDKYEELGGFDELFFMPSYGDDLDLSYRAWKKGWKVLLSSDAECFHFHQSTMGRIFTDKKRELCHLANQYLFTWKNITDFSWKVSHFFTVLLKIMTFQMKDIRAVMKALTKIGHVRAFRKNNRLVLTDQEIVKQWEKLHV